MRSGASSVDERMVRLGHATTFDPSRRHGPPLRPSQMQEPLSLPTCGGGVDRVTWTTLQETPNPTSTTKEEGGELVGKDRDNDVLEQGQNRTSDAVEPKMRTALFCPC